MKLWNNVDASVFNKKVFMKTAVTATLCTPVT